MSKNKIKTDGVDTGLVGRYRKKEPASASVAAPLPSTVVRQPTAVRRADFVSASSNKNACWSSFPNLPVVNSKTKLTPPQSPNKPRSKSVRMPKPPKKNITTRIQQFLGSHSNLGSSEKSAEAQSGVYTPLRPRSIGGSSDCSSNQSDLSRCDSLRDSSRSRISHMNESIASGGVPGAAAIITTTTTTTTTTPLVSYDSFDCPADMNLSPAQHNGLQEFSNLRPISIALPHSTSSISLTSGVRGGNSKVDLRYYSYAAPGGTEGAEERLVAQKRDRFQRGRAHRSEPLVPLDVSNSILDEFHCGSKTSQSVLPSDPEYPTIAQGLMTASPTRKTSVTNPLLLLPGPEADPHHAGKDSGAESLHSARTAKSLPTTPLGQTFASVKQEEGISFAEIEARASQDLVSQDSTTCLSSSDPVYTLQQGKPSSYDVTDLNAQGAQRPQHSRHDSLELDLPPGWEVVNSSLYGTYFVNHNNRTAQYQHPHHQQHTHYSRPPSANRRSPRGEEEELMRKVPLRSFSHRAQDHHRIVTSMASLPRRTKSFRDQEEEQGGPGDTLDITHERQISTTMTFVPPSPYQIKEIPTWLREYIEAPLGTKEDKQQWEMFAQDDLNGLDTMIKRLLKKGLEQIVKKYDYYRVAVQQEMEERTSQRRAMIDEERTLQRRAMMDEERTSQRRAMMDEERTSQRRAMMDEERTSQRRAMMDEERTSQRRAMMDEERTSQRRAMMDEERTSQRRAMMDEERTSQRRAMMDEERTSQRRAMMDEERTSQRRAMMDEERTSQRRAMMDEERTSQRRATVEPTVEMGYQPPLPLPVPYNQSFPQYHHQPQPLDHEYMLAKPSYSLDNYHSNQRPPYYHPSCLPPCYPNFYVVEPEATMSKSRVPETYV